MAVLLLSFDDSFVTAARRRFHDLSSTSSLSPSSPFLFVLVSSSSRSVQLGLDRLLSLSLLSLSVLSLMYHRGTVRFFAASLHGEGWGVDARGSPVER